VLHGNDKSIQEIAKRINAEDFSNINIEFD